VSDTVGERCASKQRGIVWFLAGTYQSQRTNRTCTVPQGKYLFFPLINVEVTRPEDGSVDCAGVKREAAKLAENTTILALNVDGQDIGGLFGHRQITEHCFDLGLLAEHKTGVFPSAGDGYYIMLRPLKPGKHTLNFGGRSAGFTQALSYTILVK